MGEYKGIWDALKHTDIFLPSDKEALEITKLSNPLKALKNWAQKLRWLLL